MVLIVVLFTLFNSIGELLLPTLMSQIVDVGVQAGDITYIIEMGIWMLLVALVTVIFRASASYFSSKAAMAFSRDLRLDMFKKVNQLTFDETEHFGISSLITRTTNDVGQIEQFVLMALRPLLRAPLMFVGGLAMAIMTYARLSIMILLILPLLVMILVYVLKQVIPSFPKLQAALDRINLLLRQRLTGLKVVRAFARDDLEEAVFQEANEDYYRLGLWINQSLATVGPLMSLLLNWGIVAVVYFGARSISRGSMEIGALMAYIQYVTQTLTGLVTMTRMTTLIPRTTASIERVEAVMAYPSRQTGGQTRLNQPIEEIVARNLTFAYPNAERPVIQDLSFAVSQGEILGIIGGTGSGKSTLVKLLMQFYEPTSGQLLINGIPIEEIQTEDLREEMSYVPQQNFFFTDSLRENFYYSQEDASDERMIHSLETAQARPFLPDEAPLDTHLNRGGRNFSGGQRQRLAIARALTRDASVYIFDDSFSALDYRTDYELRQALKEHLSDKMTIIIAQRVATIRHADQILVLQEGVGVGLGNHETLMRESDVYRDIAISQGEEANVDG
ncbi:ABC transporter ATP-binding protein [Suicoccus acidiformans]|uniref:ABC transporter ATP-binding protein n=2 Tax=Suicoccus acidiformans TaxID=2036206 RepID=A0A347WNT2_9LACT|nr:ABC transporter ATP-binding protein [Suicoccus acidiformans]